MKGARQWKLGPSVTADNTGILNRNQRETQQNYDPVVLKKPEKKISQIKVARACWEALMHMLDILDMNELCSHYNKDFLSSSHRDQRGDFKGVCVWGGGRGDAIWQNFRAKLLRRRSDRDQSVAMHPKSVNAALSASTAPLLPSLSLTSCTYKCCDGEHQAAF